MKNIKKILITGVIGIFVTSSVGCNMVAKTPEAIKNATVAKVNEETITSSPAFTPKMMRARWIAAVPEVRAATCLIFRYSANSFSNAVTFGPKGAIQLVLKASLIYFISLPLICGDDSQIFVFINLFCCHYSDEIFKTSYIVEDIGIKSE